MTRPATLEESRTLFPEWPDELLHQAIDNGHFQVWGDDGTVYVRDVRGLNWTFAIYCAAHTVYTLDDDVDITPNTDDRKTK